MPRQSPGEHVIGALPNSTRLFNEGGQELVADLDYALYEWPASGGSWRRKHHATLTADDCPIKLVQNRHQPDIFHAVGDAESAFSGETQILWINVDNVRIYYSHVACATTFNNGTEPSSHSLVAKGTLRHGATSLFGSHTRVH
jgi:hypothetical protein